MKLLIILTLIQIITSTNLKSQAILRKSYLIKLNNATFTKNSFNSSIKNESILRKQHILILNLK
jgi:hypothetical protein